LPLNIGPQTTSIQPKLPRIAFINHILLIPGSFSRFAGSGFRQQAPARLRLPHAC
jgi:hypothetical protein